MYYYIYDSFLEHPKYRKILDRVEIKLADLSIAGEAARVRPLRNLEEIVLDAIVQGKRTLIAVGNDYTFKKILNAVLKQSKVNLDEITLGIIPINEPNSIAKGFGISLENACETISSRIIKIVDVGKIKNKYFITRAIIGFGGRVQEMDKKGRLSYLKALRYNPRETILKLDDKFQIRLDLFRATIINLSLNIDADPHINPQDGILNIVVTTKMSRFILWKNLKLIDSEKYYNLPKTSIFRANKIEVLSPGNKAINIFGDNQRIGRSPAIIKVLNQKLRVIVGKERSFD